jgi:hypothetical protein
LDGFLVYGELNVLCWMNALIWGMFLDAHSKILKLGIQADSFK